MKKMKLLLVPLLGCLPFTYQYILLLTDRLGVPYLLMFVFFLLIWAALGYAAKRLTKSTGRAVLLLNLPAAIMLVWLAVVVFAPGVPWPELPSFVHSTPLIFYLPFAASSMLYAIIPSTMVLYTVIFGVLVIVSVVGAQAQYKNRKIDKRSNLDFPPNLPL